MAIRTTLIHFFFNKWTVMYPMKFRNTEATVYDCFLFSRKYRLLTFWRNSFPDIRYAKCSEVYPFPINPNPKATPLAKVYNNSRPADKIPVEWKSSVTCPIYKKGCKNSVANYRPINFTSVLSKFLERIVKANILQYLKTASILNVAQHGFMPRRSCPF